MKRIVKIRATGDGADILASHLFLYEIEYHDGTKSDIITDVQTMGVIEGLSGVRVIGILEQQGGDIDAEGRKLN